MPFANPQSWSVDTFRSFAFRERNGAFIPVWQICAALYWHETHLGYEQNGRYRADNLGSNVCVRLHRSRLLLRKRGFAFFYANRTSVHASHVWWFDGCIVAAEPRLRAVDLTNNSFAQVSQVRRLFCVRPSFIATSLLSCMFFSLCACSTKGDMMADGTLMRSIDSDLYRVPNPWIWVSNIEQPLHCRNIQFSPAVRNRPSTISIIYRCTFL